MGRELKYIHVTEHLRTTLHHHLIVQHCDTRIISQLWKEEPSHLRASFHPLDDSGQYKRLAEYLIKETAKTFRSGESAYRKRFCDSRNLLHPKPKTKKIKAQAWRAAPVALRGYMLETDSIETGTNPFTGLLWQKYSMVQIPPPRRRPARRLHTDETDYTDSTESEEDPP